MLCFASFVAFRTSPFVTAKDFALRYTQDFALQYYKTIVLWLAYVLVRRQKHGRRGHLPRT